MKSKNIIIWMLAMVLAEGAKEAEAGLAKKYFPLSVGNSWTYVDSNDGSSTKTFTIIGTEDVNGNTYYKFDDYDRVCGFGQGYPDDDMLFRYDPNSDDKVLQYLPSLDEVLVRYDFSGDMWGYYGNQMIETDVNCTVPAGEFDDCCKFHFATLVDCGIFYETLAPGVGNIKFINDNDDFELQSYTVAKDNIVNLKDYAVLANNWQKTGTGLEGDINGDETVDYNDLEIMASRWLYEKLEDDTEDFYSCEGDFDPCYPCSNAVDENWDTYALPADPGATSYIYENYTIPPEAVTADFTMKYEQTAAVQPELCSNVTDYWDGSTWTELECTSLTQCISALTVRIPDDGLSEGTLQLRTKIWKWSGMPGGGDGRYYEGKVIWYYGN